ncbi:NUMOD4 domain-containing protein [Sporosarcina psychrophila]|uniref:HNH nuclease domain-containing protein n=1 Tax=Sporosarcina psychrophila TaxID=1476 RepID=A0ABV2KHP6_SPOPS
MEIEIWKEIGRFTGYEVSNLGRVRSNKRGKNGAILKPRRNKKRNQYWLVYLVGNDEKYRFMRVHRLVALAFCPQPIDCNVVNHNDGDKLNNVATNLEWTTKRGNNRHAYENGLRKGPVIKYRKVVKILDDGTEIIYSSVKQASRENNISDTSIRRACTGAMKTAAGSEWKFVD